MRSSGRLVGRRNGRDDGAPDSEAGDLPGRRDVALEQQRRHAEGVRDVVEPERRVVRRERAHVRVKRQQVPDGVAVLRAVHPVELRPPRVRGRGGGPVERRLQPGSERRVGVVVGARAPRWRHRPAAQLLDHLLPPLRVGGHVRLADLHVVERQPRREQPAVVAGDAVALEERTVLGGLGRRGGRADCGRLHGRCGRPLRGGRAGEQAARAHREHESTDEPGVPSGRHRRASVFRRLSPRAPPPPGPAGPGLSAGRPARSGHPASPPRRGCGATRPRCRGG